MLSSGLYFKVVPLGDAIKHKIQEIKLVSSTKTFLHKFREHGWDPLFDKVKLFCKDHEIEVPNLSALYKASPGSRVIVLSSSLDPRDNYKAFGVEDICKLMNDFYLDDFTKQEKLHMKIQLEHFQLDAHQSTELQKASTVAELCQVLAKTNKSSIYHLFDRIIRLMLTLPVSIVTAKRAFSVMKIVKTRLCNRMEGDFLSTYLVTYIEKEIAQEFSTDSIIHEFDLMKKRRVQLGCLVLRDRTKAKFF
ncbi:hypothetical protein GOBAR_DD08705 [Gossypium barbadense]|nr:hypothetical protein GOBAR_DD08705 [Gossypium barbadense]